MFALGAMNAENQQAKKTYVKAGAGVAKICQEMYNVQYTHLHGENVRVDGNTIGNNNNQYLMRPGMAVFFRNLT
jgi:hypothetical protein